MSRPDLNQLFTLDVLLSEGSVAKAAKRLKLSPSAMSRALARLRDTLNDPLLVRAGRKLVPTPRALELRERVESIVQEAKAVLRPTEVLDLAKLNRTFTLRSSDGFVETFGANLIEHIKHQAPGVRLCFMQKPDKDSTPLRDGLVDLETGVIGAKTGPEVRTQALFKDRFVGAVRAGHPLGQGKVTLERFLEHQHINVSRRGIATGPVEGALEPQGLRRDVAVIVGGFSSALSLARSTDLIACVPDAHTRGLQAGVATFELPCPVQEMTVSLLWHPRMDGDPGHRWLRELVKRVCMQTVRQAKSGRLP